MLRTILALIICFGGCVEGAPKVNQKRLILTKLRDGGDYAHAGDEEAIELVISKASALNPQVKDGPTLDVGSGFGGTADYLYRNGFRNIFGVDIDPASCDYARGKYPHIHFTCQNANLLSESFPEEHFAFVTLFNVFYAIENKKEVLEEINKVSKPKGVLALFDYSLKDKNFEMKDLAGKAMYPLDVKECKRELEEIGWQVVDIQDITNDYVRWYTPIVKDLSNTELMKEFNPDDVKILKSTFEKLTKDLQEGRLGGVLIIAQKK